MSGGRPRWWVPEVIQTSAMDCGPAVLKAALAGFGVPVHLGHLRTACQTDVDGTSVDTLEDLARKLGLRPLQTVVPVAHLGRPTCLRLPAVVVTAGADGARHFILVWRRVGGWLQVMDPAAGRIWLREADLLPRVYRHQMRLPVDHAAQWLRSPAVRGGLSERLDAVGAPDVLDAAAPADGPWTALAGLWGAVATVEDLVASGVVARGPAAARMVDALRSDPSLTVGASPLVDPEEGGTVGIHGAVVLALQAPGSPPEAEGRLGRALSAPSTGTFQQLGALLQEVAPRFLPLAAMVAVAGAVAGVAQAALLRALLDAARWLPTPGARAGGMAALLLLAAGVVGLSWAWSAVVARVSRRLELTLRARFHARLPQLELAYFTSRLQSDLAERAHAMVALNSLPRVLALILQNGAGLLATLGGILWLDPGLWTIVGISVGASVLAPVAIHPLLASRELRRQTYDGALSRTYLDAMLGAAPIRAHGAEEAVRRDHEALLTGWQGAARDALWASVGAGAVQGVVGICLAVWMVADHLSRAPHAGAVLLLIYWAVGIPRLGNALASAARSLPAVQGVAARLFETLDAPTVALPDAPVRVPDGPMGVVARNLVLRAGGQPVLTLDHLEIRPGERVAIVGPSGAGKSTLLGALLGWIPVGEGSLQVGGLDVTAAASPALRRRIAWVDPAVRIWNRSLLDNLRYGQESAPPPDAALLESAELLEVLEGLRDGLSTPLGADGGTLSGGQGQRVRLGRALGRPDVGLVLLDEAFRGLDRQQRKRLLGGALHHWSAATVVCVTHDLAAAADFDRVLVVDGGRIVEDGHPEAILAAGGTFARLHAEHRRMRDVLEGGTDWQRWHVADGQLRVEVPS